MNLRFLLLRPKLLGGRRVILFTFLAAGGAMLLGLAVFPVIQAIPFFFFFGSVAISAWLGGVRQGLLGAGLGSVLANYFFLPPPGHWSLTSTDLLRIMVSFVLYSGAALLTGRLREAQDQAQGVLASVDDGFCVLDRDWKFLYVNTIGAQLIDKPKSEIIGRNYWKIVEESLGTIDGHQLKRCADERVSVQFEARSSEPGRWFQIRAYPLAAGISVFFKDISATKERDEKVRLMLDRMVTAHKAAQMGPFEWNLKSNELVLSDEACRNHGLTSEQWDGRFETWVESLHPEDSPGVLARIKKAVEEKSEFYAEFRLRWPDGEFHWLAAHGHVTSDERGDTTGIVGICSDITHRRLQEEALRRSEKLTMAGRLAATIAHEINNPLEAITNLIYLLRHDASTRRNLDSILLTVDEQLVRVNHIAKQTLGFYRDRNEPEVVDVVQLTEELLSILQSKISSKQITVEREFENVGCVFGCRGELQQVLSNLLTNAIDASPSGGKLIMRVKPDLPLDGRKDTQIRIEVEDFGSGIQPCDRGRVFEPFFTTKSDFGTGLGLWLSRQLVEKHGGTIDFSSKCQEGKSGTCFRIVLPARENAGKSSAAA